MTQDILALYETVMGRFKFFRQFLQVLLKLFEYIRDIADVVDKQGDTIISLASRVKVLEEENLRIAQALMNLTDKPNADHTRDFTSATGIMDRHHEAIVGSQK